MQESPALSKKHATSQSLGKLVDFDQTPYGIAGNTDYGRFEVMAYSDHTFRIRITLEENFETLSYALVAEPKTELVQIEDTDNEIILRSNAMELRVSKDTVRFSFYDLNGNLLNEDDKAFGTSWIGEQVTTYKTMQDGERFIGLGEKTGPLDRRGKGYQNWNTDRFAYGPEADPLYATIPFYIGLHHGLAYGIFFDNSHKSHFNFGASNDRFSSFSADSGEMNYYFMFESSLPGIINEYTTLTGTIELPPRWSIGFQQCRYSYYPDKAVETLARNFREKSIPADVIVFDIHYMEAYKIFTWDKDTFPDPAGLLKKLRDQGFHVVVMCDPGIKIEEAYEPYLDGLEKDVFLKYPDGSPYSGEVWPGWCHFPDFTNEKTREWWASKFKGYMELGVDGFWNDMNEIATWGQMLPELIEFEFEGQKATTRKGRNIYGLMMAKSTFEGTKALLNGKRPFNLTRAGYSGIQRYGALWTGDNVASDEHMIAGVRLVNSLGVSGVTYCGFDTGGFAGDANVNLFTRWLTIGAFTPFFRVHAMINSRASEPWSYGEESEQTSRNYISLRYRMMPYLYSLFYEASQSGMPVSRTLALEHPHEDRVYDHRYQNQFTFGPYVMVAPVESYKEFLQVFLPKGDWYGFHDGKKYQGDQEVIVPAPLDKLPLFIKGGAILPMQKNIQHDGEDPGPDLILHVYNGQKNTAFELYEDDGTSYAYEKGAYRKRKISFSPSEKQIHISEGEGTYSSPFSRIKLVLHGFENLAASINGAELPLEKSYFSFLQPITKFDPLGAEGSVEKETIQGGTFDIPSGDIKVTW